MNKSQFKDALTSTYQASSVGKALGSWSSDHQVKLSLDVTSFAAAKSFDTNIAIIGNFVLNTKNSIVKVNNRCHKYYKFVRYHISNRYGDRDNCFPDPRGNRANQVTWAERKLHGEDKD